MPLRGKATQVAPLCSWRRAIWRRLAFGEGRFRAEGRLARCWSSMGLTPSRCLCRLKYMSLVKHLSTPFRMGTGSRRAPKRNQPWWSCRSPRWRKWTRMGVRLSQQPTPKQPFSLTRLVPPVPPHACIVAAFRRQSILQVHVHTGDEKGAGTDANVRWWLWVTLGCHGDAMPTARLPSRSTSTFSAPRAILGNVTSSQALHTRTWEGFSPRVAEIARTNVPILPCRNKFQRASVDEFEIQAVDLGDLQKVKVRHDNKVSLPVSRSKRSRKASQHFWMHAGAGCGMAPCPHRGS